MCIDNIKKKMNLLIKYSQLKFKLFLFLFLVINSFSAQAKELNIVFASKIPDITNEKLGTYSQLSTLIQDTKKYNSDVLFLFGGGSLGPSAMATLDRGSHIVDILNSLEPDVMAIDNREFSFYEDELSLRSFEASFPMVSSNTHDKISNKNIDGIEDFVILQKGDLKIGFISVLKKSVINEYNIKRTTILDINDSITKISNHLKSKGVDIIIVHSGEFLKEINNLLEDNTIDLAFTKDPDLDIHKSTIVHKRYIIISTLDGAATVKLKLNNQKIIFIENNTISLSKQHKDPNIENKLHKYESKLDLLLSEKIGIFKNEVNTSRKEIRTKENSFANFVADVFRNYANADIALVNAGAIRGNTIYQKGHLITRKDIYQELPYRDKLILLQVSGQDVIDTIEHAFYLIEKNSGRFPQVSGIKVTYDTTQKPGHRVRNIFINNLPIDKKKLYKLVTTTFIATGGDGNTLMEKSKRLTYKNMSNRVISDIVVEFIKKQNLITPKIENRLNEINRKKQ